MEYLNKLSVNVELASEPLSQLLYTDGHKKERKSSRQIWQSGNLRVDMTFRFVLASKQVPVEYRPMYFGAFVQN